MFSARHLLSIAICFPVAACLAANGNAADWIMKRSRYTHDPHTQQRVTQYSPIGPFYANDMQNYMKSGFRYSRSSIQVGPSMDHLHTIEEWGRPVEPYGAWRYPYRPYSAPYQAWGPPYGGLNIGVGYGYFPPYGAGISPLGPKFGSGLAPGLGGGYYPPNNWTNPFGGPAGADEYYPDAPSPSRLQWRGPFGF